MSYTFIKPQNRNWFHLRQQLSDVLKWFENSLFNFALLILYQLGFRFLCALYQPFFPPNLCKLLAPIDFSWTNLICFQFYWCLFGYSPKESQRLNFPSNGKNNFTRLFCYTNKYVPVCVFILRDIKTSNKSCLKLISFLIIVRNTRTGSYFHNPPRNSCIKMVYTRDNSFVCFIKCHMPLCNLNWILSFVCARNSFHWICLSSSLTIVLCTLQFCIYITLQIKFSVVNADNFVSALPPRAF